MNRVQQIQCSVRTARRMTLGLAEDLLEKHWTFQPFAGFNHAAWTLVHLLVAEDWGPTALGDPVRLFAEKYDGLMDGGPRLEGYPEPSEVLADMQRAHDRFLGCLDRISDSDLDRPTHGSMQPFAPDLATLLHSHVWHEGFHCGQLAVARKALGLPPKFG